MTEGVSTRLHKDLEKMDARIDEKLEKLGDKVRTELFSKLKHALDHFNSEVSSLKQFMQKPGDAVLGKQLPEIIEMESSVPL